MALASPSTFDRCSTTRIIRADSDSRVSAIGGKVLSYDQGIQWLIRLGSEKSVGVQWLFTEEYFQVVVRQRPHLVHRGYFFRLNVAVQGIILRLKGRGHELGTN